MNKIAQKRGPLTKLRELVNVPTEKLMGVLSPQFVELMDQLRDIDDTIREHALDLKGLLKVAKTNFNRREYMTAISFLGRFHDKVETINEELAKLNTSVDAKHNEFLFNDLDPENIEYLTKKMGPKFKNYKSKKLGKTAGITDWWHNITDDRGRALAAYEKRFPKKTKELKRQISNIINKSETLLSALLSTLKLMASYRAQRKLEDYLKISEKFTQKYALYDGAFSDFYNTYISKFIAMQEAAGDISPDTSPMAHTLKMDNLPALKDWPTFKTTDTIEDLVARNPMDPKIKEEILKEKAEEAAKQALKGAPQPSPKMPPPAFTGGLKLKEPNQSRVAHIELEPQTSISPTVDVSTVPSPTIPSEVFSIDTMPEDIEPEETMRSPVFPSSNKKEKPIQVSMSEPRKSHKEFLDQLNKMSNASSFEMAVKLIKYADEIKTDDCDMSEKLIQLSKKLLAE